MTKTIHLHESTIAEQHGHAGLNDECTKEQFVEAFHNAAEELDIHIETLEHHESHWPDDTTEAQEIELFDLITDTATKTIRAD